MKIYFHHDNSSCAPPGAKGLKYKKNKTGNGNHIEKHVEQQTDAMIWLLERQWRTDEWFWWWRWAMVEQKGHLQNYGDTWSIVVSLFCKWWEHKEWSLSRFCLCLVTCDIAVSINDSIHNSPVSRVINNLSRLQCSPSVTSGRNPLRRISDT